MTAQTKRKAGDIEYVLSRKSVKNLNLRVGRDGVVRVSAPGFVRLRQIDSFVLSNAGKIEEIKKRISEKESSERPPKKYESGETFPLLGKNLRLEVLYGSKAGVALCGDRLVMTVRRNSNREKLMAEFYDRTCRAVFTRTVQALLPQFSAYAVAMPEVKARTMKSRWGSCAVRQKTVTLNRRLIEAPAEILEYVALHELCHFVYPDHSKNFYGLLSELMPDWKERKNVLNKTGIL